MSQHDVLTLLRFKRQLYNARFPLAWKVLVEKCIRSLEIDVKETA